MQHVELLFLACHSHSNAWRCHLSHEKASDREAAQEEKGRLNSLEKEEVS